MPQQKYAYNGILHRKFQWDWQGVMELFLYASAWLICLNIVPNTLWVDSHFNAILFIGLLGTWRYLWWFTNLARSFYFLHRAYPKIRHEADTLWQNGWRPSHIHFLMTTFHERERTTFLYLDALVRELRRDNLTGTLWVGFGANEDAACINKWLKYQDEIPLRIIMVKQNQPGKRVAIGVILRALSRHGVGYNDIAYLMDGDSIIGEGLLQKTLSLFGSDPELVALTTDEDAVVEGPLWVQKWLTMRFAQRRMWMQSHALSKRVLTLTGRTSAYRATRIVERDFIRTVEADQLNHWLWGNFRFLSGDDKSTWYCVLKKGGNMLYVPDTIAYTIEYIEGWGLKRMRDNLLRWSGNMLRNGTRAILLGPRKMPFFIWWCLIDQRISIWTVLMGFSTAISITLFINHEFIYTYLLWVMFTRFIMACSLFFYSDRIRISYPFILYLNQLFSALLKVYILFHLPKQRWTNRQSQKGGDDVMSYPFRRFMALYINLLYVSCMLFIVLVIADVIKWPSWYQFW